jgi:hypothetical protein
MTEKDIASYHAYSILKTLEHFYNGGEEGKFGVYLRINDTFGPVTFKQVFNLKDQETAQKFIEEQKELLKIFYQL